MLYRSLHNIPHAARAVAIGNFDGMHLGHRHIIKTLIDTAKEKGLRSCVIIFEPQPQQFFLVPNFKRIMSFREKYSSLLQLGVDDVVCLNFNVSIANTSCEDFYETILINKLGMRALVVGHDFRFGKDRKGDLEFIRSKENLCLKAMDPYMHNDCIVSSSKIRGLIASSKLSEAADLLGEPYSISGKVMHGRKLASSLGFKTANLKISDKRAIQNGVYVVLVNIDGKKCFGVANVGVKPTVGESARLLEVHCFDNVGDIYGKRITVSFLHLLRSEQKFSGLNELVKNIENDVRNAKIFIKNHY